MARARRRPGRRRCCGPCSSCSWSTSPHLGDGRRGDTDGGRRRRAPLAGPGGQRAAPKMRRGRRGADQSRKRCVSYYLAPGPAGVLRRGHPREPFRRDGLKFGGARADSGGMRRALFTAACVLASVGVVAAALTPTGSQPSTEDGVLVASAGAAVEVAQTATTSTVPRPTTSTTLAPATTRVPRTTAPARSAPARQSTSATASPSFPVAPFPAGAEPFGMYGMGAAKTVTNGPDSVTMRVYPYDLSLGSTLQLSTEMAFVGGRQERPVRLRRRHLCAAHLRQRRLAGVVV